MGNSKKNQNGCTWREISETKVFRTKRTIFFWIFFALKTIRQNNGTFQTEQ